MLGRLLIAVAALGLVLLVPILLRQRDIRSNPRADRLVIVSPHNEAIRFEFEHAFQRWYQRRCGREVDIDWRTPGGTSEIVRHLTGEYTAAVRQQCLHEGRPWNPEIQAALLDRKLKQAQAPSGAWETRQTFLNGNATIGIDLLFGGGQYDLQRLADMGILIPCGLRNRMPELFAGTVPLVPQQLGGEIWYDPQDRYYGVCLTAFGICYNPERLREAHPGPLPEPRQWAELGNPAFFGLLGVGDPSKSGSIAKAFEMLIQQQMMLAVAKSAAAGPAGTEGKTAAPSAEVLDRGWEDAMLLIKEIGANARYFTNGAGKVPMDVAAGDAAAGMCIDFYGRFEAGWEKAASGRDVLRYVTPAGGSSVSADPIGLLRGAPHAETARLFIDFLFTKEGQRLWNGRVGSPGGPLRYSLRRLPIRRDLYVPEESANMSDPEANPFALGAEFTYHPEWTGALINVSRLLIRVMVIDCHDELRAAWQAIRDAGGPDAVPAAMTALRRVPFSHAHAGDESGRLASNRDAVKLAREWADFFRKEYREARDLARAGK